MHVGGETSSDASNQDKDGNPIDVGSAKESAVAAPKVSKPTNVDKAGVSLLKAVKPSIADGGAAAVQTEEDDNLLAEEGEGLDEKEDERVRIACEAEENVWKAAVLIEKDETAEEALDATEDREAQAAAAARLVPPSSLGVPRLGPSGGGPRLGPGPFLRPGSSALTPLRLGGAELRPGGVGTGRPTSFPGFRPGGTRAGYDSLQQGLVSPAMKLFPLELVPAAVTPATDGKPKKRRVFTKEELMRFRDLDSCCCRPLDLADMTIQRDGGGDRGRRGPRSGSGGGVEWVRGQGTPKPSTGRGRHRNGGRGLGGHPQCFSDGPVAPLVPSGNRWVPTKDTSTLVVAEKAVKSILGRLTRERFERYSDQICQIPILSYSILTMMIRNVYEVAIREPAFGDMYADLFVKLSQTAKLAKFTQMIESDEVPPAEDRESPPKGGGGSGRNIVYRWSNDVVTNDPEVVGPLESPDECVSAALADQNDRPDPVKRGDLELNLYNLMIRDGFFIKIMQPKDDPGKFYSVFFPVSRAKERGQQMSEIFLSKRECKFEATKQSSFERCLLNKCEDEFNKEDLYVEWKKEKKTLDETRRSMKEADRLEEEEELEIRRMKIKKQMLGNIKFIGELYKKDLLQEKIMRYCIHSLLKLKEDNKTGRLMNADDDEMDEEDHEALCNLFKTIGKTIDHPNARHYMEVYFGKMKTLSIDKKLSSRSRFMYKDLIKLRADRWKRRMKQERAKTLDQIREDMEREERQQRQLQGWYSNERTDGRDSRAGRGG